MRNPARMVIVWCLLCTGAGQAQGDPFAQLLSEIAEGAGAACRVAVAEQRISEWRQGPSVAEAFASVDEIMASVEARNAPIEQIIANGCEGVFVWSFVSCTDLDDPRATHIVRRGVTADTDAEFAEVLRVCFAALEAEGLRP